MKPDQTHADICNVLTRRGWVLNEFALVDEPYLWSTFQRRQHPNIKLHLRSGQKGEVHVFRLLVRVGDDTMAVDQATSSTCLQTCVLGFAWVVLGIIQQCSTAIQREVAVEIEGLKRLSEEV